MVIDEKKFTITEIKSLLREAYDYDECRHRGKVAFSPVTMVEWRESDVYKEELVLRQGDGTMLENLASKHAGAYYHSYKRIFGFLELWQVNENIKKYWETIGESLAWYVKMVFHELYHFYDHEKRDAISNGLANFDTFIYDIQQFMKRDVQNFTRKEYHNKYLFEIQANIYGINRAREFLESKGLLTVEGARLLTNYENEQMFLLNNIDIHDYFHKVHSIISEDANISKPYLDLFYGEKKATVVSERFVYTREFRDVGEILELATKLNVDERILMAFFSSKDFLDNEGQSILCTFKYRPVIMRAIEYALEIEKNRRKKNEELLQNKQITFEQFQEVDDRIRRKIEYLTDKKETLEIYMLPAFDPDNRRGSFWDDEQFRR